MGRYMPYLIGVAAAGAVLAALIKMQAKAQTPTSPTFAFDPNMIRYGNPDSPWWGE